MRIGTKSLLYGAHCFLLHPIAIALAWTRLYGLPWHPALWLAFIVHDWGYWGKPDMDGVEGTTHPELGAKIVGFFFGNDWHDFTLLHSRRYAKLKNCEISQLCIADKLATVLMPAWLFLLLVRATGEIKEYRKPDPALESSEYLELIKDVKTDIDWFNALKKYMSGVIALKKDNALDIRFFRRREQSKIVGTENNP